MVCRRRRSAEPRTRAGPDPLLRPARSRPLRLLLTGLLSIGPRLVRLLMVGPLLVGAPLVGPLLVRVPSVRVPLVRALLMRPLLVGPPLVRTRAVWPG